MEGAPDTALDWDSCRCQHFIQRPAAMPGFHRVQDEFGAVLGANDSGRALILCQCVVAGLLMLIGNKIGR